MALPTFIRTFFPAVLITFSASPFWAPMPGMRNENESKGVFENIFNFTAIFKIQFVIEEIVLYRTTLNRIFKIDPQSRFAFGKEGRKNSKKKEEFGRLLI